MEVSAGSGIFKQTILGGILNYVGPGANPTTLSYNASVVKFYSATNSMRVL
jgi:hypothetical protein